MVSFLLLFSFPEADSGTVSSYSLSFCLPTSNTTNLKLDSQLKQQAEYQKPTASGGGSDSGNTPEPNPDGNGGEAPDPGE